MNRLRVENEERSAHRKRAEMIALCAAALCLLVLLAALMPYVDDDWDWGTQGGIERLGQGFADYNGRYLGNLLVLLLTRSPVLKALCVGMGFFLIAYLPARSAGRGSAGVFLLSLALLFLMPTDMLGQTMAWASGFANYGASAAVLLLVLALLGPVWRGEPLSRQRGAALFTLALTGSLFMEHVTICLVCLSAGALAYASLQARRVQTAPLLFLAGAAAGAAIMFTNGGYGLIGAAQDPYRAFLLPQGQSVFAAYSAVYAQRIRPHLFEHNLPLMALLAAEALIFANRRGGKGLRACGLYVAAYAAYLCLRAVHPDWAPLAAYTTLFENGLSLLCAAALFCMALHVPDVPRRRRMVCLLLLIAALSAPLLVVRPVNARNFLPMYALQLWFALELFGAAGLTGMLPRLRTPLYALLAVLTGFLLSVYSRNAEASRARVAYAQAQAEAGATFAYLPRLPYERPYVWAATPGDSPLTHTFFKAFYDLPEDMELRVIDYDTWFVLKRLAPEQIREMTEDEVAVWLMDEAGMALKPSEKKRL